MVDKEWKSSFECDSDIITAAVKDLLGSKTLQQLQLILSIDKYSSYDEAQRRRNVL